MSLAHFLLYFLGITDPYKFRECLKIVKRYIAKKGLVAPGLEKSESRMSLSVTLPNHSPNPEESGEPDSVSQVVEKMEKTKESNVLKPRTNVNLLKVHNDSNENDNK